jgi:putative ABC transport system permease protein
MASAAPKQIIIALMSVFAAIALLLAAVGLYAVMAYAASQHMRKIGVRMALGARSSDILRLITWQGLKLILAGLALGMVGAFALMRVMEPLL